LGRGGCVFGSSPKRLEWPHLELVHWWLLVHSSLLVGCGKIRGILCSIVGTKGNICTGILSLTGWNL